MSRELAAEIAITAARLVVDEGLDYGSAKRRAVRELNLSARTGDLPSNDMLEEEVRARLALFHADTQPGELAALRAIAATWMERLAAFRPHLAGAVWRGTATRLSTVHIDLYCDDSKAAELALIAHRVDYDVGSHTDKRGRQVDILSVEQSSRELGVRVQVAMSILDYDDLRGALRSDSRGRRPRGDLAALRVSMAEAVA